jgi:hypothetical protein
LEDATREFLAKGYAIIALNPKQNYWDPVRKTPLVLIYLIKLIIVTNRNALQQEKIYACGT